MISMIFMSAQAGVSAELRAARAFDKQADRFKSCARDDDPRWAAILERLGDVKGRYILDFGCGKGRFGRLLRDAGALVIGLDVAQAMLRAARGQGLSVARGTSRSLPFSAGQFDAVIAVEVFEHIEPSRLGATLEELSRVLKPEGRLVVIDKSLHSADARRPWIPAVVIKRRDERLGRGMYRAGAGDPQDSHKESWFWPRGLARRIAQHGFEQVTIRYILARDETRSRWSVFFRRLPWLRKHAAWSAVKSREAR